MRVRIVDDVAVSPNGLTGDRGITCFLPSTWRMQSGDLICTYRQGREKYSPDGVFMAQRSSDGGTSWSAPALIFDGRKRDPSESMHGGVVCEVPNGDLLAIFTTVESLPQGTFVFSEEGKKLPQHLYISRSGDGGRTWSAPREHRLVGAPRNAYIGSRPLVLPDGALLLPVEGIDEKGEEHNFVSRSYDGGQSLSPLRECAHDRQGKIGYGDARLTTLPDGSILMLLWTWRYATEETLNVHRCLSADNGLTWSPPESTNVRCQIMNPCPSQDGTLVAVGNVRTPPAPGIHLWFSRTAGKEWTAASPVLLWDALQERLEGRAVQPAAASMTAAQEEIWKALPGFTFGTPELTRLEGNQFLLSYYATRDKVIHIRACRFEIEDL
jgi:hypothetical protein